MCPGDPIDEKLNDAARSVRIPWPVGAKVRDLYTGIEGVVSGYTINSDMTLSADITRVNEAGDPVVSTILVHRLRAV